MPIERDRYPQDWDTRSFQLKADVDWICQRCGKPCRQQGETLETFMERTFTPGSPEWQDAFTYPQRYCLTVAHLDQDPSNNQPENLLALCAPCHLAHDRPFMTHNAYAKRERRGQLPLELREVPMLVVTHGRTQNVCTHPQAVSQGNTVYCPDCQQTFSPRTKVYKQVISHESRQILPPKKSSFGSDSQQPSNPCSTGQSDRKTPKRSGSGTARVDCQWPDQTCERDVSDRATDRTPIEGDSWNTSPEGHEFWQRVDLVWPFLSEEEQHWAYFSKAVDCYRTFETLETVERRRKFALALELEPDYENYGVRYHAYDLPRPCTYLWGRGLTPINGIAFGERQIGSVKRITLVRLRYEHDGKIKETDANIKYVKYDSSETPLVDEYTQRDWPEYFQFQDQMRELEAERDRLTKAAEFAPDNGWIETGRVKGKNFRQAWWRGKFANGKKTIYIGREGSPEYAQAKNAQQARKQLKKVLRQIKQLKQEASHADS